MTASRLRLWIPLATVLAGGLLVVSELRLRAQPGGGAAPDVIVGAIPDIVRWGSLGDETAFSIATTSCNIGTAPLDWLPSPSPLHPVITQNLYRVHEGRIEQIGMSWLKHGFSVAPGNVCGQCEDPFGFNRLGVNCSDPYGAGLNGFQSGVGPRSEVNAATGQFTVPFTQLPTPRTVLDGRIRVLNSDLDPSQNAGARYFVESQYVHLQDAAAGNSANNASYREVFVDVHPGGELDLELQAVAPIVREDPAILAWKAVHSDVQVAPPVDVVDDGRILVAWRTTPLVAGGFRTAIAVENLTSHRSVRSIRATFGGTPANPGFHDADYQHEPYQSTDWPAVISGPSIEWSTDTFAADPNANALRWGTLYTFWCDSPSRPTAIDLRLFRPGNPDTVPVLLGGAPSPPEPEVEWAVVSRSVDLGSVASGKAVSFGVACRSGLDRSIQSVASSNKAVKTRIQPVKDSDGSRYRIEVLPDDDAISGYFESILTISTGNESDEKVTIRVFGDVR